MTIYEQMLSRYAEADRKANFEVMQQIALAGLYRTADINAVKADVAPFVLNPRELEIWSNDYFLQVSRMMQFE